MSVPKRPLWREIFALALPLAAVQVGTSMLGVIDTAVVGRTTPEELAAVGLGNSLLFAVSIIGMGLVLGSEPIIAQALGAGDLARARRAFRQGTWAALLATPILLAIIGVALLLLPRAGVDEAVLPHVIRYVLARSGGVLPFLLYWAIKAWLQAHGRTRAPVIGVVVANVVELGLCLALVEPLGVLGAGVAHSITTTVRLGIVVLAAERALREESLAGEPPASSLAERAARMRAALRADELAQLVKIGLPLGLQMSLEVAVFAFAALTMGQLGARELAAHQVALQCASTTFNFMVGLGSAASVVVGRKIGAGEQGTPLRAGLVALAMSVVVMAGTGLLFLGAGAPIARLLTDQEDVVVMAATLLVVAAAFQLSDGLQTVASGALRGAGDTRATFVIHLVSHWLIGMPCVVLLSRRMGAAGVWWGLTLGLVFASVALVWRFVLRARRGFVALERDAAARGAG